MSLPIRNDVPGGAPRHSACSRCVGAAYWLVLLGLLQGCGSRERSTDPYGDMIKFKDDASSNAEITAGNLAGLAFTDRDGKTVELAGFRGQKHVVLVVTRGYVGSDREGAGTGRGNFCTYCSTQTSRLIANYGAFQKRGAEVLLVFPVAHPADAGQMSKFAAKAQDKPESKPDEIPFPLVVDLELAAVNQLGIRDDLSKPATYILDKQGDLRFAYVGKSLADRPSIKAMLSQLDAINRK